MRNPLLMGLLIAQLLLSQLAMTPARADEAFELINGANVIGARATAAPKGGASQVTLRLENYSNTDIKLIGVRSGAANSGALMIRSDGSAPKAAAQYLIRAEETLDLATSHIWLELSGLKIALTEGAVIDFELVFQRGVAQGVAHVHR